MNDSANIKQVVSAFLNIVTVIENQQWVKSVTSEDIKAAFKLGCFVEKAISKFDQENLTEHFIQALKVSTKANRNMNFDKVFFCRVCDHILIKFFKNKSLNEHIIDTAIRMYTSLFPKERLQLFLKNYIMLNASFESIFDFTISCTDNDSFKYELILQEWSSQFDRDEAKITSLIVDCLGSFKVASSLQDLIGILALNVDNSISRVILAKVREKMLDRSILAKTFWLTLCKNVDKKIICEACKRQEFCEDFCNFLLYIGGMMEKNENNEWLGSEFSVCPEITFKELETIFVCLCLPKSDVKTFVINKLKKAQECTDSSIWKEILRGCL